MDVIYNSMYTFMANNYYRQNLKTLKSRDYSYCQLLHICQNKPHHQRRYEAILLMVATGRALLHNSTYTPGNQLGILVFEFIIQE